jgi:hypothetical protein
MAGIQALKARKPRRRRPKSRWACYIAHKHTENTRDRNKIPYIQLPGGMPNAGGGAPKPDGNGAAALPTAEAAATVAPIAAAIAAPMSPNPGGAPAQ